MILSPTTTTKRRTAMVCGKLCTAPEGDYFVTCSFDSNHVLLRSRMPYHIIKCVKRHPGHNKQQCPYDATEYIDMKDFESHVLNCESKRSYCAEKFETAELKAKGTLCNIKQTPFFHSSAPEVDDDWGGSLDNSKDEEEDFSPRETQGVGRGVLLKKDPPKKGRGRAEILQLILKQYQEKKFSSSYSPSGNEKLNSLSKNVSDGQFDDE